MAQAPKGIDSSGKEIITQLQENGNRISELENIKRNLPAGTPPEFIAQIDDEIRRNKETVDQLSTSLKNFSENCVARNVDITWMRQNIAECKTYLKTEQYAYWAQIVQTDMSGPDPCGSSTIGKISKSLQKFFTFLKGIKKYYNTYVQGTLNAVQGLASKLRSVADLIQGALRILIQRVRNWVIQKVKNLLSDALNSLLPNLAKTIKDGIIKQIIDVMFCKFTEIMNGLATLVTDFLFSLIGNFINAPFCAAEELANSLINNLANRIDKALGPILDQVNSIVGSIGNVAGSVFQVIDKILGFEKFLCSKGPECPEIKDFRASWWAGPSQAAQDKFEKFLTGLQLGPGDNADLLNQFDKWLTGSAFGGALGRNVDPNVAAGLECNTGAFRCGPPQVQIFGGGGVGAVGKAIVNTVGQVVGVDLVDRGYGYTSPPFVTFIDNCGNGNYASAYAVLGDPDGENTYYDPVTGAPIGESTPPNPTPGGDVGGGGGPGGDGEDGDVNFNSTGCVYDFSVFHEFDNDNNVHLKTEISSSIDVEFKSKDAIDGNPALPALDTNKHYSIKFKVPYDNDQYTINVYDKASIAAAIQQDSYIAGQTMEVAAIKNKTRFGFDIWFGRKFKKVIETDITPKSENIPATRVSAPIQKKEVSSSVILFKRSLNKKGFPISKEVKEEKYTIDGGKLYGPVRFNKADPGCKFVVYKNGKSIAALDPGSAKKYNKSYKSDKTDVNKLINQLNAGDPTDFNVELKSANPIDGSAKSIAKFVEKDNQIYLDLTGYTGKVELNMKFSASDSVADKGWSGWEFQVLDTQLVDVPGAVAPKDTILRNKTSIKKEELEFFKASYIRYFKIKTVGKRDSCIPGAPLKEVVMTNSGGGYLPGPNNKDEFGNNLGLESDIDEDLESEAGLNNSRAYVGCLSEIQVIGTGIGYSPEDTVSIIPDIPGLQVKIQLTEQGQIVNMLVESEGCGISQLPDITINSETGTGAEFRPIIRFTSLEEFNRRPVSQQEIIRVIDCV